MPFKNKVRSNTRVLNSIIRKAQNFGTKKIEVGYYENQMHPKWHIPLSEIATINEFGYFKIPPRNFMWQSFWNYKNQKSLYSAKDLFVRYIYRKQPYNPILKEIGEELQNSIKWTIQWEGKFTGNAEKTIKLKGRDYPLVNTGYLMNHAKFKILK